MSETTELDQALAEAMEAQGLGDYAWQVADRCPQGHQGQLLGVEGYSVGQVCPVCCAAQYPRYTFRGATLRVDHDLRDHESDPIWHPEWRFGRTPKPLSTDASLSLAAVEAWMGQNPWRRWWMASGATLNLASDLPASSTLRTERQQMFRADGPTPIAALARAFLAALKGAADAQ